MLFNILGQGKFGKVYLACGRHEYLNREHQQPNLLACKVMANRQQGQTRLEAQQNREALQQEIAILRVLKHKNAVAMIDSFET